MTYVPAEDRYERMVYNRSGRSGLMLPAVSLGLWNNFGHDHPLDGTESPGPTRRTGTGDDGCTALRLRLPGSTLPVRTTSAISSARSSSPRAHRSSKSLGRQVTLPP
jgi:hypothetical protein